MPEAPVGLHTVMRAEDAGAVGKVIQEGAEALLPARHSLEDHAQRIGLGPVQASFEVAHRFGVAVILSHAVRDVAQHIAYALLAGDGLSLRTVAPFEKQLKDLVVNLWPVPGGLLAFLQD